jgi:hypothetical protein
LDGWSARSNGAKTGHVLLERDRDDDVTELAVLDLVTLVPRRLTTLAGAFDCLPLAETLLACRTVDGGITVLRTEVPLT